MSIQQNLNQMLSIASLLASQTQRAADVKEAKTLKGIDKAAVEGLIDIEGNLERYAETTEAIAEERAVPEEDFKMYSKKELENIGARRDKLVKDIYDVKAARLNPRLKKLLGADTVRQGEIAATLENIDAYEQRAEAAKQSSIYQQKKSKDFNKFFTSLRDRKKREGV